MNKNKDHFLISLSDFPVLLDSITSGNYDLYGPTVREGAIRLERINSISDLPQGYRDRQQPGVYKLEQTDSGQYFACVVGLDNWKKILYPPRQKLFDLAINKQEFKFSGLQNETVRPALLGVRACDLAALAIFDKILLQGPYLDQSYQTRRADTLIIAVNCTRAAQNCFCTSMNCGPRAHSGFDLALTEICDNDRHYFVAEIGSDKGAEILRPVKTQRATQADLQLADNLIKQAAASIERKLKTENLKEILYRNFENAHWEQIARRCLSCGNCTMVCPTCFCVNIEDETDLDGTRATRQRRWDSCFTLEHSYIHGGSVRTSVKSRYRQWLTHKLAGWLDQFGTSGCVGCGRCITWCPVGIDITEEARLIRAGEDEKIKSAKRKG